MHPKLPIEIIIETTGKCTQACPYCTGPRIPNVPLKDIRSTMDEANDLGIKAVRITGGEPLLHPEIDAILRYAKEKKFSVILNTSAERIPANLFKTIIATVDVAHVSLQGHTAQSNTSYTHSRFLFSDKLRNIFLLRAYIPTLWIATVITVDKCRSLEKFQPLIERINPAAWLLQRPISDSQEALYRMDKTFYQNLTLLILKLRRKNINVFISNPIPLCVTGNLKAGQKAFLGAILDEGHQRLVRRAQGYYQASYFLDTNLGTSIKSAWNHPFVKKLNSTDYLPDICQLCPVLPSCRGGCRAMAQRAYQTPFAPDPLFDPVNAQNAQLTLAPGLVSL